MVCLNLKVKENKDLLSKYAKLVGSEDAAYYLLAMNNGYPLDATPNGDTSDLYTALLAQAGGNEKQAVLDKALAYMPQFIEQHGDWTMMGAKIKDGSVDRNGEPSLSMLVGHCDSYSMQDLLGNDSGVAKLLNDLEMQNIAFRSTAIEQSISNAREAFVNSYIAEALGAEYNEATMEVYGLRLDARRTWDKNKMEECFGCAQKHLARVFNLKKVELEDGTVYYKYNGTDPKQKLRVEFVNSLSVNDWTDEEGVKHKGAFVDQDSANALCGIIYISMTDGDATTIVHELAHRYIRMFWNSEPVQEALLAVDERWKKFGRKSDSRTVEEALVDHIVGTVDGKFKMSDKLKDTFNTFWHKFNKMIHDVIGKPLNENRNNRQNMLDLITSYFSINKDLSDCNMDITYYEKYSGAVFQSNITLKEAFYKIEETLEAKLASERSRPVPDNQTIYNIQLMLQKLRNRDADQEQDIIETITDFANRASADVNEVIRTLNGILAGGPAAIAQLDVANLMHMKTDIINYYRNVIKNQIYSVLNENKVTVAQYNGSLDSFIGIIDKVLEDAGRQFDYVLKQYTHHVIDIYSDYLVDVGDVERFKINAKMWADNQINNGESNPLEQFFGPAVSATSPVVRLVEYITTEANRDVFQRALAKGNELKDAYVEALNAQEKSLGKKLSPHNFMKQFCELDDEGMPTGYFVGKYNRGQFNKNRDKKLAQLVDKYNVDIDPESKEFIFADRQQYIDFYTDYYNWLGGEANLRYKTDYYTERLKYLSKPTIEAVSRLDEQIHTLYDKCTDESIGVPIVADLSRTEQLLLKQLQEQKADLSNPYIIIRDNNGNITDLQEKTGDAAIIAQELSAWYYYQAQFLKSKPDFAKYQAAEQKIIQKYGNNSPQHTAFKNYQYQIINPELHDLHGHVEVAPEIQELQNRKRKILGKVKKKGYYQPHLEQLNDQAWAELQRIDQEIADYYRAHGRPLPSVPGPHKYKDVFERADVLTYSNGQLINTPYFQHLYQQAIVRSTTNPNAMNDFYSKYYYTNDNDERVPLSVFSHQVPVANALQLYGIDPIVSTVDSPFTEIDMTSAWINPDYQIGGEHVQLKDKYLNKQYDKLTNSTKTADVALGKVYNLLLKTMQEAYEMMPNLNQENYMRLPGIRDRDAHLMFRRGIGNGLMAATLGFDTLDITERDTRYNEQMTTRPDGTVVETIPQRWIQLLDDPKMTCTDVIGTVTMFYEMACNFQNKSKIAPMFQALLTQVSGGVEGSNDSNFTHQAYRLKKYIQMYVYGRTRTGFKGGKMSATERTLSQLSDKLASKAHGMLMSHNWRAVLKNALDSLSTLTQEIIAGKYFTVKDALWANATVGGDFFKALSTVGKTRNKSKVVALMQMNGATNSISEIFSRHNETWLRRVFGRFFHMGEYNLVDYTFKGWITVMTYHAHRLMFDPSTNEMRFMTRDQARFAYHKAGMTVKQGDKAWKDSKETLWDAYELDDRGSAKLKDSYRKYVRPEVTTNVGYENETTGKRESRKLETRVHGIIRERSAIVNGVLDSSSGAAFSQNYLGALVLQMRGWFLTQNFDNLKNGHDFAEYKSAFEMMTQGNEYAREAQPSKRKAAYRYYKSRMKKTDKSIQNEDKEFEGQYNFETGTIEKGQWRSLSVLQQLPVVRNIFNVWKRLVAALRGTKYQGIQKRQFTRNEIYALRRITAATGIFALTSLSTILTAMFVTKYPKEWASEFLYAVNVAAISERAAQIPIFAPLTFLDIVNSVAISKSFIDNLDYSINFFGDAISAFKYDILGVDPGDEVPHYRQPVNSGSYKDYPVWFRDAMKFSGTVKPEWGIDNIIRNTNPYGNISSSNYYINKVAPTGVFSKKADRTGQVESEENNVVW